MWFRTSLSPTRTTTQVRTTYVRRLGHRSALSIRDLRPSILYTYHNRWSCYLLCLLGRWKLCPCSAMSRDEGDAASGCAMFWKSVSVFGSENEKGSIVKRAALRSLIQSMQQRCRGSLRHYISRVLQSPLPRDSQLHDGECGNIWRSLP